MGITSARVRQRTTNGHRAALAGVVGAAIVVPLGLVAGTGSASATSGPQVEGGTQMSALTRAQHAPNVFYPLIASSKARDLKRFRGGVKATELVAPCGSTVRAVHPGTVRLVPNVNAGGTMLTIASSDGKLTTSYGYLGRTSVSEGQILSAGQPVGQVGDRGLARGCMLRFKVTTAGKSGAVNPTDWLETNVGKRVPESTFFGNEGFTLANINALGASHTAKGGDAPKFASWATRMPRMVKYMRDKQITVAGMQEFQKPQHKAFLDQASEYAAFPANQSSDTENAIVWRQGKFKLLQSATVAIPYFNGKIRKMPYVLLQQKSTGRSAWFINVHNPADTRVYKNQGKWRSKAVQIEKDLVVRLRSEGRPVFLTGDMNDRRGVFCAITAGKLALSPDSVPSMECAPPKSLWIDWIFGAGQTRFTTYNRDWSLRDKLRVSDHPAIFAKTYLAQ